MNANTKEVAMSNEMQYSESATYEGVVLAQEWDGGDKETLKLRLDVKVTGRHQQAWRPEKGVTLVPEAMQEVKSVYLTLDPTKGTSFDFSVKDLRRLGFNGMNFLRLSPAYAGADKFSLIGKSLGVRPKIKEFDGKTRVYWNLAVSDGQSRPATTHTQAERFLAEHQEAYAAVEDAERSAETDVPY